MTRIEGDITKQKERDAIESHRIVRSRSSSLLSLILMNIVDVGFAAQQGDGSDDI